MAATKIGRNCAVKLGSTQILGLGTWTLSGIDSDVIEDTEFGDDYKTYQVGFREGGTITFNGYHDPTDATGQTALKTYWRGGNEITSLRLYVDSTSYWSSYSMDEDCAVITDWTDGDNDAGGGAGAASTQTTYDGKSCFSFYVSTAGAGTFARRTKSYGDIFRQTTTIEAAIRSNDLGTLANVDYFELLAYFSATLQFRARFATDGLYIYDGTSDVEVGTDIVSTGSWQVWKFEIRHEADATANCDVYLDNIFQEGNIDCSSTGSGYTAGDIVLTQNAATNNTTQTYLNYLRAPTSTVEITSWEVSADKADLVRCSFTAKVDGHMVLQ